MNRKEFSNMIIIMKIIQETIKEIEHLNETMTPLIMATIPEIYACSVNFSTMPPVGYAVATENFTGAVINNELTMEIF